MSETSLRRIVHTPQGRAYLWLACWNDTDCRFRVQRPSAFDLRMLLAWECRMALRRSSGLPDLPLPMLSCADVGEEFHATQPEHARSFLIHEDASSLAPHATQLFRQIERHRQQRLHEREPCTARGRNAGPLHHEPAAPAAPGNSSVDSRFPFQLPGRANIP